MADFGTSAYWLELLNDQLSAQAKRVQRLDDYYRGKHNLAFATDKFRDAFGGLFTEFSDNFCRLVPDAVHERLRIQGFRMGRNLPADSDAWRIWQANNMDAKAGLALREALVKGETYLSVWAGPDPKTPRMTVESAEQMIVVTDPGTGRRLAALKRWEALDGHFHATLYLPDRIEKYRTQKPASQVVITTSSGTNNVVRWPGFEGWEQRQVLGEEWPLPNPLGVVPIIPLVNQPRLDGTGEAEHQAIMPLQDAINKEVADMLVASEFAAFRQRWATGVDIPVDETTGQPIDSLQAAVSRAWMTSNEGAKFGDFSATDLDNYVKAIEMLIQHVATISRTPPHYLLSSNVMPNGESQSAAEAGLVAKCHDRMRDFSEPLEEVMRLAFRITGDEEKAGVADSEVIWADPEYRSMSSLMDALIKLQKLGVPNEVLWEKAQFSPQEIERIKALNLEAELSAAAAFDSLTRNATGTLPNPEELKTRTDVLRTLINAGYTPDAAAEAAGLPPMEHTGNLPTTLYDNASNGSKPAG